MKAFTGGVLDNSDIYFYTPSNRARKLFLYILCTGKFNCDSSYLVDRQRYNSFLILYVVSGEGIIETHNRIEKISSGHFAFIDCYEPHKYYTNTQWEIIWVHFDGTDARKYYEDFSRYNSAVILPPSLQFTERKLIQIYEVFKQGKPVSEDRISLLLMTILTEFLVCASRAHDTEAQDVIEELLPYISENLREDLTIDFLSDKVNLSPFYFNRLFKKKTGVTTHKYILVARINAAQFLLKTTISPVKKIALDCGFTSESSFCTAFKKIISISPLEYRSRTTDEFDSASFHSVPNT